MGNTTKLMKIITVIGARPQFVKAAALSRVIHSFKDKIEEIIIHTGQHFDANMSEVFFEEMEIPKPHYNLNINGLSQGVMTGQMLFGIEEILIREKPDYLLVYGDTNSTIAGALAAVKLHIKVIHIEAGLRSFNTKMPEEINRILTDRISSILFCPTPTAIENLKREGFLNFNSDIVLSGDIMLDAALFYKSKAVKNSAILDRLKLKSGGFVLSTIHRAENTDNPQRLKNIVGALNQLNKKIQVVIPLHPRTLKTLKNSGLKINFMLIEPVGYFDMLQLISNCKLVLTDSGGLQKEAYFFHKFCVTLRDETEWIELVSNGYNFIVGTDPEKIMAKSTELLNCEFRKLEELYGKGNTAQVICQHLVEYHKRNNETE